MTYKSYREVEERMKKEYKMIAVCGLVCDTCDIRKAKNDPKLAKEIADIHCSWCKGDRENHWSPDCWILECCVDKKGLEFCYECEEFPCKKLKDWAKESEGYTKALNRLKEMQKG